eukprot:3214336-Rhodomonas_salina.3
MRGTDVGDSVSPRPCAVLTGGMQLRAQAVSGTDGGYAATRQDQLAVHLGRLVGRAYGPGLFPYARPMRCPVLTYRSHMPSTVVAYRFVCICVAVSYAMPATDTVRRGRYHWPTPIPCCIGLRACYAKPGTDAGYNGGGRGRSRCNCWKIRPSQSRTST